MSVALLAGVGTSPVQASLAADVQAATVAVVPDEPSVEVPSLTSVSPAIAGAGTIVTLEGSGFAAQATDNTVTLNGVPVSVNEATATRMTVVVPSNASSGRFKVVTAAGSALSTDFTVPPPGYTTETLESTQRVVAGGDLATVTISAAGKAALVLFDGLVGHRVSLQLTLGTIGTSSCCAMKVSIRRPDGVAMVSPTYVGSSGGYIDVQSLVQVGTYTIVVDPEGTATGTIKATLFDVPADIAASTTPGAEPLSVTTSVPGQAANVTFPGTTGNRVSLRISPVSMGTSSCCGARLSITKPDGSVLLSPTWIGTASGWVDALTLPATGTYRIRVDPESTAVGSATLKLYDVPVDATGTIVPGGAAVKITTTSPGQNAALTFEGDAGHRISLQATAVTFGTSSCCGAQVSIVKPDGTTLLSPQYIGTSNGWIDVLALPVTGTYTLKVDPASFAVGSATFTLNLVPADPVMQATAGGDPVTLQTSTPGQNGSIEFDGTSGQRISIVASPVSFGTSSCCAAKLSVTTPAGVTLVPSTYIGTSSGFIDVVTLPGAGTYIIRIDPSGAVTGSATVRIYDVLVDPAPALIAGGDPVTLTTTTPGQNLRPTFSGGAGQRVSLKLSASTFGTSSCCGAKVSLLGPTGATVVSPTYFGTTGRAMDVTLPSAGGYTVVIDPQGAVSGAVTVLLSSGPSAPTISSSTHPEQTRSYESGTFEGSWMPSGDPAGISGYAVVVDDKPATVPPETVTQSGTSFSTAVEQGTWYLHVRAVDTAGYGGTASHFMFRYDTAGPGLPTITITTHPDQARSYQATGLSAAWNEPADPSGVAGYSVVMDGSPTTVPPAAVTQTERTFTSTLTEGTAYLHVRAVDGAGHWGATATFKVTVDTTGAAAPAVESSTHPNPEQTYTSPAFVASWAALTDPAGVAGYAVVLDKTADTAPGGSVTQETTSFSTTVGGGVWYLHVRAIDGAGNAGVITHFRVNVDDANGVGPTLVTNYIVEDTVWGPQGSPYVIEDSLRIVEGASLTLLPGTIVKFKRSDRFGQAVVLGQLLALGTPKARVTFTSYKDDTAGGDTNGDGAATKPAPGDWYHLIFYGAAPFSSSATRPVSVVDYADIRFGGYGSGVFMCSAYGSIVAASNSRLVVSNSDISQSQWSGIHSSNTQQPGSFLGVYNNRFSTSNCGVVARTGDVVGNVFEDSFREYAFMSNSPDKVRFQYNTVRGVTLVVGSAPTRADADVRFNTFHGQVKDWPAANQDLTDYSANWWGYDLNTKSLPPCMSSAAMGAHNPPMSYSFTEACSNAGSGLAQPTGYFTKVLPALSSPPPALPGSLSAAASPSFGPVNTATGSLTYSVQDLGLEDAGKLISATRTYRSDHTGASELGAGWFAAFEENLSKTGDVATMALGSGNVQFTNDTAAGYVPAPGVAAGFASDATGSRVTTPDQTTYQFSPAGELTGMLMGDEGHQIDVDREGGLLSKVTGSSGRSLTYTRADGRLQAITDSGGRSVSFGHAGGRVVSATGVDGKTMTYAYDGDGRLTKVMTPLGRVELAAGYGGDGRVAWVEQPGAGRSTFTYSPLQGNSVVRRSDGTLVDHTYDDLGRLVQERVRGGTGRHVVYDAEGHEVVAISGVPSVPMVRYSAAATATWFDGRGNPAINVDAMGRTTEATFNAQHQPLATTRPDGSTISRTYDAQARLTRVVDPAGAAWAYTHNSRGQITGQVDPLDRLTSVTYEADGDIASVTDVSGGTTTNAYDALGRAISVTDAMGQLRRVEFTTWSEPAKVTSPRDGVTLMTFDDDRNVVTATDPEGGITTHEYDNAGRVVAVVDPAGGRTSVEFDVRGRPVKALDARSNSYLRRYTLDDLVDRATGPTGQVIETAHDPLGRQVRVTDPLGNVTQQTFDRTGILLARETPDGAVHGYGLDALGRVTRYTAPDAGVWATVYDANDHPTAVTDPLGQVTRRSYDATGRLIGSTDAAGSVTAVAYDDVTRTATSTDPLGAVGSISLDALGRVVKKTDARGGVSTSAYDPDGNLVSSRDPEGGVSKSEFDLAGRVVAEIDPVGRRIAAQLDAAGRITTKTYPGGATEAFTYDQVGNLTKRIDRTGAAWTYGFDASNQVTAATDPLGHVTTHEYDPAGHPTRITDPTGRIETSVYDAVGRLAAKKDAAGATWGYEYDFVGNLTAQSDPAGVRVLGTFDKGGQLTRVTGGPDGRMDLAYDALGQVTSRTDAAGKVTAWDYDARSRLVKTTDALSGQTVLAYDAVGNVIARTSPSGRGEQWSYDLKAQMTTARDGAGNTSNYSYDSAGALTKVVQPRGGQYGFTYDANGRLATQTTPGGGVTSYGYDAESRPASVTAPSGKVVTTGYDTAGRVTTQSAAGVSRASGYDDAGRMTTATSGEAVLAFGYDPRGLLASSTDGFGTSEYQYDVAQRMSSEKLPGLGTSTFAYDTVGRVASVRGVTNLNNTYDSVGRLTKRTAVSPTSSANTESRTYDALGRLLTAKSATAYSTSATYNTDSQIASLTQFATGNTGSNTKVFGYDQGGRLLSEAATSTGGTTATTTYGWDDDSNRTSVAAPGGPRVDSVYDAAGRLSSSSDGATYEHSADGNLTSAVGPGTGTSTYGYNGFGQLATATVAGTRADYTRDPLGRTAVRSSAGVSERMGYRGGTSTLAAYRSGSDATTMLARDPGGALLAQATLGGTTGHVFSSIHGDVGAVLDETSGQVKASFVYDAFGQAKTAGVAAAPLGFQSMLTDPMTGLVDMGFRQYDPKAGRFTAADNIIGALSEPVTLNRYTYANADPLNFFDPDGHFGFDLGAALAWGYDTIVKPVVAGVANVVGQVTDAATGVVAGIAKNVGSAWNSPEGRQVRASVSATFKNVQQAAQGFGDASPQAWSAIGGGHGGLDLAGAVPVIGEAADLINGFWYLAENDQLNAGISFAGMVPVLGAVATGARVAKRAFNAGEVLVDAARAPPFGQVRSGDNMLGAAKQPARLTDAVPVGSRRAANAANGGARFVVSGSGEARAFLNGGLEVGEHAGKRMIQKGISLDAMDSAVLNNAPFKYFHQAVWKTGYFDRGSNLFVGSVEGKVTTVFRPDRGIDYIRDLQAVRP